VWIFGGTFGACILLDFELSLHLLEEATTKGFACNLQVFSVHAIFICL